jgi:hypothetical protein
MLRQALRASGGRQTDEPGADREAIRRNIGRRLVLAEY